MDDHISPGVFAEPVTEEIKTLQQQINLVKAEQARLSPGEYALLMMLEHAVQVIELLNRRTMSSELRRVLGA